MTSNRTIWVHRIPPLMFAIASDQTVNMPKDSEILHCREQHGDIAIWFDVPDQKSQTENRTFRVYGTGQPVPDDEGLIYLDTCLFQNGDLVLHVFEVLS